MQAITTALTGLHAASTRIGVSANNTVNFNSTVRRTEDGALVNDPYRTQDVQQTSLEPAGTQAIVRDAMPATNLRYDPTSRVASKEGIVETPGVSLDQEVVNQTLAKHAYSANLKTLRTAFEMQESLVTMDRYA